MSLLDQEGMVSRVTLTFITAVVLEDKLETDVVYVLFVVKTGQHLYRFVTNLKKTMELQWSTPSPVPFARDEGASHVHRPTSRSAIQYA